MYAEEITDNLSMKNWRNYSEIILKKYNTLFYKNNFIRTWGSLLLNIEEQIKNNPSLSRKTKSQIFNLRTNICNKSM